MGMFDSIYVFMLCPYCKRYGNFEAQTKDLDNEMWSFTAMFLIPDTLDRTQIPVFKKFPLDKEAGVWASQQERTEAAATIPKEYQGKLNCVDVVTSCPKCDIYFKGKIAIKDNRLVGEIYDIGKEEV